MNTANSLKLKLKTVRTMNQELQVDQLVEDEQNVLIELKVEMFLLAEDFLYETDTELLRTAVDSDEWIMPVEASLTEDELREAITNQFGENLIFVLNGLTHLLEVADV